MSVDYSKFDSMVDLEGLKNDAKEAEKNEGSREYTEVPHGTYEVSVEKMELTESKKGDPMVTIWFNILNGEFKNSKIFMNQVITLGFQLSIVKSLLRSMDGGIEIEFESYTQFANLLMDVHEAINGKLEFALKYGENNKGYSTFKIEEVFEV